VIEKILEIRRGYQMGAWRIKYYLERYHGVNISESTVSRTLKVHGVGKLPKTAPRRSIHTKCYAKTVPGHHVQVDVKFLNVRPQSFRTVSNRDFPPFSHHILLSLVITSPIYILGGQ
jgi:hypothetical protein